MLASIKACFLVTLCVVATSGCTHRLAQDNLYEFATLKLVSSGNLSPDQHTSVVWQEAGRTVRANNILELTNKLGEQPKGKRTQGASLHTFLNTLSELSWILIDFEEQYVFHHEILSQRTTFLLQRRKN